MVICFKSLSIHFLRKVSQINKRHWRGSIYKQALAGISTALLFLSLCFTAPGRQQSVSPVMPSAEGTEQRNLCAQLLKRSTNTSGPVNFQNHDFCLKIKKGQDEHKTDCQKVEREWQWLRGDSFLRGFEMG